MSADWKERFHEFLAEYVREVEELPGIVKVLDFREEEYDIGFCETCSYIVHELVIMYEDEDGETREYRFDGSISSLFAS